MRLDLHIHSRFSADSQLTIKSIIKRARRLGLGGVAITDHNSIRSRRLLESYKGHGMLLVPGIEVSSEKGHILGYMVSRKVPKGKGVAETIEDIIDAGGLPVAAHPYRRVTGLGEKATLEGRFDVVEAFNGRTRPGGNQKAMALAERMGASVTGGSDAHTLEEIGRGFTEVPDDVATVDDLIEAIRKGRTSAGGTPASMRKFVGDGTGNVVKWVRRGMRRM